jgi:hypothetical protein
MSAASTSSKGLPMSKATMKVVAGVAALAAIAFGASAIAGASGSGSNPSGGRIAGFHGGAPPNGAMGGGRPGAGRFGTPVTGATAAKVKAAALAKYPGTLEQVAALPGGGYIAHVFTTGGGEVHVLVNSNFVVTGLATRPPGGGPSGGPPAGAVPPGAAAPGAAPSGPTTTS